MRAPVFGLALPFLLVVSGCAPQSAQQSGGVPVGFVDQNDPLIVPPHLPDRPSPSATSPASRKSSGGL